MLRVISYGSGVQSTALLVLAAEGKIDFKTALFCNVGDDSENPDTLKYLHEVAMPYAREHGIELIELQKVLRTGEIDTLYQRITKEGSRSIPIPIRVSNGAPGNRSCTADFKIKVVDKWLRENSAKLLGAIVGLGISLDEFQRVKPNMDPDTKSWKENVFPLIDLRMDRQDCINVIQRAGLPVPPKSACYFCLAGETEVLTPQGAKPIRELVGKSTLLVPIPKSGTGKWQEVEVRSFGVQPLMKLTLRRGRSLKDIYATAEHRWVTKAKTDCWQSFTPTSRLQKGDVIPSCTTRLFLASPSPVTLSPFGIAHGFVYGDGILQQDQRPARVVLHGEKDKAMLPYFALCPSREILLPSGKTGIYIYNLPRQWKERPPLSESRSYLGGWLAGYFAADGHVSKEGQATLYSADEKNVAFVRDVCSLIGVRTSPVVAKIRKGFNGYEPLYSIGLSARDLPEAFWLNNHHLERIQQRIALKPNPRDWLVESVELTDRVEEVFCAIVPGVEMFVLADNVVTGNCPFHRLSVWQEMRQKQPDLFWKAAKLEELINERRKTLGKDKVWLTRKLIPLALATTEMVQGSLFEDVDEVCDSGYCMM